MARARPTSSMPSCSSSRTTLAVSGRIICAKGFMDPTLGVPIKKDYSILGSLYALPIIVSLIYPHELSSQAMLKPKPLGSRNHNRSPRRRLEDLCFMRARALLQRTEERAILCGPGALDPPVIINSPPPNSNPADKYHCIFVGIYL